MSTIWIINLRLEKSEKVDPSDRAVRYQGSRPTSRRIPKALRRK